MPNGMRVFGGSANPQLTNAICRELGIEPVQVSLKEFADQELYLQIQENIRGCNVYIVQPTCAPVNTNFMQLVLMCNAAKLASAKKVTAVMPYFGYARQDRKDKPRVPISAKVVAQLLETQRIKRVLTMDLHSAPIQGFFNIPVDHFYALPVFIDAIKAMNLPNPMVVSPDAGGTQRARKMAKTLGVDLAIIDKHREEANVAEVMNVIGNVQGKDCILVDDLIDTAGTLCKGAVALMDKGARSVRAVAAHGVFSFDKKAGMSAKEKINASPLVEVLVTDSIPQDNASRHITDSQKIKVLTVAPLFAKAIQAVENNLSVSDLFV